MSYGVSAALQAAVYQHLAADVALSTLVGTAIYDAVPAGTGQGTLVAHILGPDRDKGALPGARRNRIINRGADQRAQRHIGGQMLINCGLPRSTMNTVWKATQG